MPRVRSMCCHHNPFLLFTFLASSVLRCIIVTICALLSTGPAGPDRKVLTIADTSLDPGTGGSFRSRVLVSANDHHGKQSAQSAKEIRLAQAQDLAQRMVRAISAAGGEHQPLQIGDWIESLRPRARCLSETRTNLKPDNDPCAERLDARIQCEWSRS